MCVCVCVYIYVYIYIKPLPVQPVTSDDRGYAWLANNSARTTYTGQAHATYIHRISSEVVANEQDRCRQRFGHLVSILFIKQDRNG
jgi:hypothetical protein